MSATLPQLTVPSKKQNALRAISSQRAMQKFRTSWQQIRRVICGYGRDAWGGRGASRWPRLDSGISPGRAWRTAAPCFVRASRADRGWMVGFGRKALRDRGPR